MGWWHADKNGQIDFNKAEKLAEKRGSNFKLANAMEDEGPLLGDMPADSMDRAIEEIIIEYKHVWGRLPTMEEMDLLWKFCTGCWRKEGLPWGYNADGSRIKRKRRKLTPKARKAANAKAKATRARNKELRSKDNESKYR